MRPGVERCSCEEPLPCLPVRGRAWCYRCGAELREERLGLSWAEVFVVCGWLILGAAWVLTTGL